MNTTSRRVHGGEVLGATPAHPLLVPALSAAPGLSMSRQQALLDQQAIQRIPGLAGYWPADPAYLYQDSAGYIPATVGGVVGQVRDISNAATPVARRNLLTYSEQFDNAAWVKTGATISSNAALAPDGTLTADLLVPNNGATIGSNTCTYQNCATSEVQGTHSVYLKAQVLSRVMVQNGSGNGVTFDLLAGTIAGTDGSCTGQIISIGSGWYRCTVIYPALANPSYILVYPTQGVANGSNGFYIWGAQIEVGGEATPYQKIVTGTGDVFAPGNHAYQTTTANKPYLRKTPSSNVYWLDSNTSTSALTATLGNLGASCTVAQAGAEGVTFTEGVTISSTYNIAPAYGFNTDIAIFNRALTATEKALVTRYMARGVPLLGSNLVTNGDFSNGLTGFTLDSTAINNNGVGVLDVTSGPASNEIVNPFPVIISSEKSYLTQYDVLTGTDPTTILVRPVPNTHIAFGTLGHKSYAKIATSNATTGSLLVMGANIRLVIDNLSIKEIL